MADDDAPELRAHRVFTGNQVIAHNLRRARQLRGWTQEQAAGAVAKYLGVQWSKAVFSAAERSVDADASRASGRIRPFDADELLAFAQAFDLPVGWFFLPPLAPAGDETYPLVCAEGVTDEDLGLAPADLLHLTWNQNLGETLREAGERIDAMGEDNVATATARGAISDHIVGWTTAAFADALTRPSASAGGIAHRAAKVARRLEAFVDDDQKGDDGTR